MASRIADLLLTELAGYAHTFVHRQVNAQEAICWSENPGRGWKDLPRLSSQHVVLRFRLTLQPEGLSLVALVAQLGASSLPCRFIRHEGVLRCKKNWPELGSELA